VKLADSLAREVHELSDEQLSSVHPDISSDIRNLLSGAGATSSRTSISGTSTQSIKAQLETLSRRNADAVSRIEKARTSFSRMMSI
jgi:argininosuccinate lyase